METLTEPGAGVAADELAAIEAAVRAAEPAYLADLERLVNIDCGSYTPAGVDDVGSFVAGFLADSGARVERRPDQSGRFGGTVIGTWDGDRGTPGAPRLLLVGHMDTVFHPGTAAERPFAIEGDGIAHGPGVTDMKSGLLAGLYAVRIAAAARFDAAFERVTFIANPDEEIGSLTSTPHIREFAADARSASSWSAPGPTATSSRRGKGSSTRGSRSRPRRARGRRAGEGSRRCWRPPIGHPPPRAERTLGRCDPERRRHQRRDPAERRHRACRIEVDMRAVRRADLETAEAEIRSMLDTLAVPDTSAEITEMARWWPMEKLERSGRLVDHAQALAARLGFSVKDAATGGASDANTIAGMGVASIDGLGPIGGMDHSPAEYLEVASVVPRTALVAALVLAIGRDPEVARWRAAGPVVGG